MKKVLIIGSLNMDYTIYLPSFPKEGETVYGSSRYIQPGGKGANQAVALAKSKRVEAIMLGAIGKDKDGEELSNVLKENGVHAHLVLKDNAETGNATISVDSHSENQIIIIAGANGELSPEDIDLHLLDEADYVLLQNEIPQKTNEFVMKEARRRGKTLFYNPAPYRKIPEEDFAYVDYFLPNRGEFANYSGESDMRVGVAKLLSLGVKNVLITLGTEGSILFNKDGETSVKAYKVKALDSVAAGDTYIGYFIAGLASGCSVEEAMDKASFASSLTVSRRGSLISIPLGEEVYE